MRLILVLTILLGFNSFSSAEHRHYDKNMVSQDKCLQAIAKSKSHFSRDLPLAKNFLVVAWDDQGNCVGLDQRENPHVLKSMSICMVQSPPLAQTVDGGRRCFATTPNWATLCELPMQECARGARSL